MKIALGNRRQLLLWGALAAVLVLALAHASNRGRSGALGGPIRAVRGIERESVPSLGPEELDPSRLSQLTASDLDSALNGGQGKGSNIFRRLARPPRERAIAKSIAQPAAPPALQATARPPEASLTLLGTFGPRGQPIAALTQGGQVVTAREGDVVFERFRILQVGHDSVEVSVGETGSGETRKIGLNP